MNNAVSRLLILELGVFCPFYAHHSLAVDACALARHSTRYIINTHTTVYAHVRHTQARIRACMPTVYINFIPLANTRHTHACTSACYST